MKTMKSFVSLVLALALLLSFAVVPAAAETTNEEAVVVELGAYNGTTGTATDWNGYAYKVSDETITALEKTSWIGSKGTNAGNYTNWTSATGTILVDGVETEGRIVFREYNWDIHLLSTVKYLTEGHTVVFPKDSVFTVDRTYGGTLTNGGQVKFAKTYNLTYNAETAKPVLGFEPDAEEKVTVELGAYNGTTGTATDWNGYAYKVSETTSAALAETSWIGSKGTNAGNYTNWTSATGTILVDGVETEGRIVFREYNWDIHLLSTVKYLTEGHTVVFPKDSVFTVDRTYGGTLTNGGQVQFAENYQLTYDTATSKPVLSVVVEEDPIVTAGVAYFADANNYGDHYYGAFGGVTREENTVKILANEAGGHIGFRLTKNAIKSMIDAGYKTVEFKMTTAAYEEGNIPTYINAFAFGVYPSTYQSSYTNATVQGTDAYYASGSVLKLDLVELYYNGLTDGLRFILKNNNGGGGANGAPAYVVLSEFQFTKDDVAETPIGQMTLAASYENGENGEFGGVTAVGENGAQILANAEDGVAGFQLKRSAVEKLLTFGVNEMTFTLETAAYNGGAVPAYVVLDAAAADYVVNCETVAAKIDGSKLYFAAGTQITIRLQKLYADMTYTDGLEFVLLNGDTWESGSETAYLTLSGLTFEEKLEKLDLDLVTTNGDFTSYYASEGSWLAMTKKSVRAVSEAGFKYVDLTLYDVRSDHILMQDGWEDIIAELKDYADECGVEFRQAHSPGYTTHGSEEWVDTNKRCIDICQMLGIENLVSHTSTAKTEGGSVVNYTKTLFFENNTANYALILPYAAEKGVNILCENASYVSMAYGWSVNTGADMREFVKYVQKETGYTNIHACWDMGHANCEGDQYLDILALGDEMYGIHFHDNTGADTHLMPYYGNMDIAAVMRAIKMMGYTGDFTLEADGSSRAGGTYTGPALEGDLDPNTTDCFEQEEILYQIAEYILTEYDCGAPVRNDTDWNKQEKVTVELTGYAGFYTSTNNGADAHFAFSPSNDTKTALEATSWFKGNTTSNDYGKLTTLTGKILVDGVEETATIKFNVSGSGMYLEMSKTYLEAGKVIVIPSESVFTVVQTNGGTLDNGGQIQFAKTYILTYNTETSKPVLRPHPDDCTHTWDAETGTCTSCLTDCEHTNVTNNKCDTCGHIIYTTLDMQVDFSKVDNDNNWFFTFNTTYMLEEKAYLKGTAVVDGETKTVWLHYATVGDTSLIIYPQTFPGGVVPTESLKLEKDTVLEAYTGYNGTKVEDAPAYRISETVEVEKAGGTWWNSDVLQDMQVGFSSVDDKNNWFFTFSTDPMPEQKAYLKGTAVVDGETKTVWLHYATVGNTSLIIYPQTFPSGVVPTESLKLEKDTVLEAYTAPSSGKLEGFPVYRITETVEVKKVGDEWLDRIAIVDGTEYLNLQEAVDAGIEAGKPVILAADATETVTVPADETLVLDLNGKTLAKLVNNGTFYGVDASTKDYTNTNYGKITAVEGNVAAVYKVDDGSKDHVYNGYAAYKDSDNAYSFHYFEVKIASVVLRPEAAGIGYQLHLAGNAQVKALLNTDDAFGVKVYLAGNADGGKSASAASAEFAVGAQTKMVMIKNIMSADADPATNAANGAMAICVDAYINIGSEKIAVAYTSGKSLKNVMETANGKLGNYGPAQTKALKAMYTNFKMSDTAFSGWGIGNIANLANGN